MLAPSNIACANWKSVVSAAAVAALNASHISLRPSNAGAVSQNSSLLLLNWPSVKGTSDFQRIVSWHNGWFFLLVPTKNIIFTKLYYKRWIFYNPKDNCNLIGKKVN